MSLWDQINKTAQTKADKLSLLDIHNFMNDLSLNASKPERQFVVQTGRGGMKMIQDSMQTTVYLKLMKDLNFSREERIKLGKMINSPDPENFQIAKIIIDNKLKEAKEYHK